MRQETECLQYDSIYFSSAETSFSYCLINRAHNNSGKMPKSPNEQSTKVQKNGIERIGPQMKARGNIDTQQNIPQYTTHLFFIGSRYGPTNNAAIIRCA